MAIRFLPDGTVEFDTTAEALSYKLELAKAEAGHGNKVPAGKPALDGWENFRTSLEGSDPKKATQRKLLGLVKEPQLVEQADLVASLKLDQQTVGGHISGIRKRAVTAGLTPDDVLIKDGTTVRAGRLLMANQLPASWR